MWRMEDVLSELKDEQYNNEGNKDKAGGLPPGFRFHPTDEELITFYLASKVFHHSTTTTTAFVDIAEVDLNRCEPWDLPERAKMGEREWYFYSMRDRKYPTGLRTNRATGSGYWKATGKDRQVYAAANKGALIGMKKTLVFYQGRAPRGTKTKWVMHEYRLDGQFSSFRLSSKEEWVICRIFHKNGVGIGGDKKLHPPTITNNPSSFPPFLGSLPPLLEASDALSPPPLPPPQSSHQEPANFLLNSLLKQPMPNTNSAPTAEISPQNQNQIQIQYSGPNYYCYPMLSLDHLDYLPHPTTATVDATVQVDMSASVAALDRLLDPPIKHIAEYWPFLP